ncbi:MAG TPA: molybdenum ABC transporter ATP-binding protein, partial [Pusillimonas sp.]|nr:molybdenum ABC transporter ATP-binding protein [Pusillimonas sp.]
MKPPQNHIRVNLPRADFMLEVDLALPATGISVLFGASGSGKTSILRCVAGLERGQDTLVQIGEDLWQDDSRKLFLPTWKRPLGYVFQEASL